MKTTVFSCQRCLIKTNVEKNEQHLNIDNSFDHQLSLSKRNVGIPTIVSILKACCSIDWHAPYQNTVLSKLFCRWHHKQSDSTVTHSYKLLFCQHYFVGSITVKSISCDTICDILFHKNSLIEVKSIDWDIDSWWVPLDNLTLSHLAVKLSLNRQNKLYTMRLSKHYYCLKQKLIKGIVYNDSTGLQLVILKVITSIVATFTEVMFTEVTFTVFSYLRVTLTTVMLIAVIF